MNLLAFDTSTEVLSAAVQGGAGADLVLQHSAPGGAQASTTLIPALQDLLGRAGLEMRALDAIVFGRGPGSFTGLRTACAVAQGLGLGAGVPVLGVDTLLAIAEDARLRDGIERCVAVLDARMDQVYWACYEHGPKGWLRLGEFMLGSPEDVVVPAGWSLAGNAARIYGDRLPPAAFCSDAMPAAAALLRLAPSLIAAGGLRPAAQATPLYIRDKVAQTTAERAMRVAPAAP